MIVRPVAAGDYAAWRPLWDGYNAFYGRAGPTALREDVTEASWARFLDPAEPQWALVAERAGTLVGLAHHVFHRATARLEPVCYLSDLYTAPEARGAGVGRALIAATEAAARRAGATRLYWQTQARNVEARRLYDRVASHLGFIVYSREL